MQISDQDNRYIGFTLMITLFMYTVTRPTGLTGINFLAWILLSVGVGIAGQAIWHGAQRFIH